MSNILNSLKGLIVDGSDNTLSSKRVVTLGSFILIGVAFFANMYYGFKVDAKILEVLEYITIAGLGVTGLEKFAPKQEPKKTVVTVTEQ